MTSTKANTVNNKNAFLNCWKFKKILDLMISGFFAHRYEIIYINTKKIITDIGRMTVSLKTSKMLLISIIIYLIAMFVYKSICEVIVNIQISFELYEFCLLKFRFQSIKVDQFIDNINQNLISTNQRFTVIPANLKCRVFRRYLYSCYGCPVLFQPDIF